MTDLAVITPAEPLTTRELAAARFENPWDEVLLCDCCRKRLAGAARWSPPPEPKPQGPVPKVRLCTIYFIGSDDGPIKIGRARNVEQRLAALQTSHPYRLRVLASVLAEPWVEQHYHKRFASSRLSGEWFHPSAAIKAEITRLSTPTIGA